MFPPAGFVLSFPAPGTVRAPGGFALQDAGLLRQQVGGFGKWSGKHMNELERILAAIGEINHRIRDAAQSGEDDLGQQIVSLRQDFATQTGNLIGHLTDDERLRANPALFVEFQDRLSDVRRILASHQAKWSAIDIAERGTDYMAASDIVHRRIANYVDWANAQLQALHRDD